MVDDTYSTIGLNDSDKLAAEWIIPLSEEKKKLRYVLSEMEPFKLQGKDVPFVIRFFENPKFNFFNFFPGAVRLKYHDCIHAILGRGLLPKDEAFVIGFTMGSTKRLTNFKQWLFLFITKYLYPDGYKFQKEEANIFRMASLLAKKMNCEDLSKIEFENHLEDNLKKVRKKLKIKEKQLRIAYAIEKVAYAKSTESQRLL